MTKKKNNMDLFYPERTAYQTFLMIWGTVLTILMLLFMLLG